jgi:hypothetical protein
MTQKIYNSLVKTKKTKDDFYGEGFSYIHTKFGDIRKQYFFTDDFIKENKEFVELYKSY